LLVEVRDRAMVIRRSVPRHRARCDGTDQGGQRGCPMASI
jgi:hypothetical protein